jgi:hypothetical protein
MPKPLALRRTRIAPNSRAGVKTTIDSAIGSIQGRPPKAATIPNQKTVASARTMIPLESDAGNRLQSSCIDHTSGTPAGTAHKPLALAIRHSLLSFVARLQ